MAKSRALTATLRPSFRPISLRHLNILNVLITLKVSAKEVKHKYEKIKMMKSKMFHIPLR
jgi:hypothetical protein